MKWNVYKTNVFSQLDQKISELVNLMNSLDKLENVEKDFFSNSNTAMEINWKEVFDQEWKKVFTYVKKLRK